MKHIVLSVLLSCTLAVSQMAMAVSFIIEDIHIDGLQRLTSSQAFTQLPLKVGYAADELSLASVRQLSLESN